MSTDEIVEITGTSQIIEVHEGVEVIEVVVNEQHEFVELNQSIKGEKGDKGDPGEASTVPGPPGNDSTVPGPPGAPSTIPGPPGNDSTVPGPLGPQGHSAYVVAVNNGFVGTQQEWLDSLRGDDGNDGEDGADAVGSWDEITNKPTTFTPSSHTQAASTITDFTEAVQDAVAAMIAQGTNVTLTYDDEGNSLTVTAAGDDVEVMRDTIGAALVGVGLLSVNVNDAGDTITISTTATANSSDAALRDRASHTGTQPANTVDGLAPVATSGDYEDLTNTPAIPVSNLVVGPTNTLVGAGMWIDTTGGNINIWIEDGE